MYWFLFKIDDLDDANILDSLMDQFPPPNIRVYSTEEIIGLSPEHVVKCCQSFTQVTFWYGLKLQYLNLIWKHEKYFPTMEIYSISVSDVARKNSSFVKRFIQRMSEATILNIFQITTIKTLHYLLIGL